MSRFEIDAAGRKVTVDHDGEIAHLAETPQRLRDHTAGDDKPGPAIGFSAERRHSRDAGETNGKFGRSFAPARAGYSATMDAADVPPPPPLPSGYVTRGTDVDPPTSGE